MQYTDLLIHLSQISFIIMLNKQWIFANKWLFRGFGDCVPRWPGYCYTLGRHPK